MRIRIRFTRNHSVKYLGHLDIMRTFQRCFNRADIRMNYSEGFNPHQKMSFALPLAVGILSRGEYLDAEVEDGQDLSAIQNRLDKVSGMGFDILAVRKVREGAAKAMAAVCFASYDILLDTSSDLHIPEYLGRDSIVLQKKTKTGTRDVDLKTIIEDIHQEENMIHLLMGCGSENSIKPELIVADLLSYNGLPSDRDNYEIIRNDLYAQGLIPLIEYQTMP